MPEIGQTLREARMRQRIDVTEAETSTKIRAKYLRALENEEWELLPGPAYVKSFLRTYAEYLGVDARLMVEEYKQRFERPSTVDLTPFAPAGSRRGRRGRRPLLGPGIVLVLGLAIVLGALYVLGTRDGDERSAGEPNRVESPAGGSGSDGDKDDRDRPARPRRVRLRVEATGLVEVCLLGPRGNRLLDRRVMEAGDRTRTFRARRFRVTFGNGAAVMRLDGRMVDVPDRADPIGLELRPGRRPRELPADERPVCS
jgi:cytoskeleton protein RodZ